MAAQDTAAGVMPVRMLLLFAAPLVVRHKGELTPIPLLPVQQEIESLEPVMNVDP